MRTLTSKLFRIVAIALLFFLFAGGCKEDETEDPAKLPELSTLVV
jgi:hypothetical protein